ncbi:MAG: squalene synthase HpnD [Acidimicrobiaceae bacterium]|nr:squalene synthase HpnD [Acidimicrobiaceae bacterium]MYB29411.1 squalene synthase HpnD [Acidimicrobiaceae bacterium]
MISAETAYRRCEEITWSEARNFAYGIRLLPPPKRRAMAALYALARRIDDVGDGDWPEDRKLAALDELHAAIDALEDGEIADPDDPVLVGVGHAASRYPIPVAALHEIVEGCEHDVRGETYATMDDTVRYCRLVAGSVGRLSLGVFGTRPSRAVAAGPTGSKADPAAPARPVEELADDLGVALQLTNMLRDIVEDHRMGRIYLPEQERDRFGIAPGQWEPPEGVAALVQFVAGQAVVWFERGLVLLDHLDYRSRACTAAMAGIYRRLLARILARPEAPLEGRVSLPTSEKALVAVRSLSGLRP